ncbi:oligosaccharyl transferase STT3 subunit [Mycena latifolia]|nr:oligosaccharyl transferase STT3 subunit [Mycena latifolia]
MPTAFPLPSDLSPATVSNTASLLRIVALSLISGAAIASRLFAVINFESIIHEFDPWFNYRATRVLAAKGFYEFWNWFDPTAWYPLGRVVGGTVYPGLMATSGVIYNFLHALNLPVDIRNICVMLAPGFSALTAWATYMFTKEMKDESAGLLAAAFIGIVPGYISRSVAGSYDNEAIAIFLLMFTFYCWIKALKLGSALFGTLAAVFYFYMVAAWGGYVFITNMIPLHGLVLILMGRFTSRLYVAYSSWYVIGTLSSMQVPFVGFQPVSTSEHMAALGVFGLLQIVAFTQLVRSHVSSKQFQDLLLIFSITIGVLGVVAFVGLTYTGSIAPWTGRFYSLWDTGYAKKHIPIIASVSEHQPTAWPSFFMDLQFLIFLFPAGVVLCFHQLRDEHVFVIIYAVMASYFAGVMVRLMLTLTPVVCVASAVAFSSLMDTYLDAAEPDDAEQSTEAPAPGTSTPPASVSKKSKKAAPPPDTGSTLTDIVAAAAPTKKGESPKVKAIYGLDTRMAIIMNAFGMLAFFVFHCTWATSNAYSSPSVVLASTNQDGSQHIIDDFREAYYWLRQNTPETAVVMSWWDYGYQIAGMADRPTLVDNNTWNNTHIATVGKAMSSSEEVAYPILRKHDVDYVLVIFGGLLGYSGDDINKFLWMVRIAQGVWPEEIQEPNYFTPQGEYRIDDMASPAMKNSLMYKMSYYRFNELFGGGQATDRVRNQQVPKVGPTLDYLDEAYTTENWIVRIYEVRKEDLLGRDLKSANAFAKGKKRKRSKPVSRRRAIL